MNLPDFTVPPKAIALDLDGTLLDSRREVSERNRRALERCAAGGLAVIISTARPVRWMSRLFTEGERARLSFVNQNGGVVRGAGPLAGAFKEVMPRPLVEEITGFILRLEPEMRLALELDGYEFGTNRPRDAVTLWGVNAAFPEMQLTMAQALEREVTKVAVGGLERDLSRVMKALAERFGDALSLVPSDGLTFLNVTVKEATKTGAIKRLVASAGWTLADVLAFGDDIPDLEMLRACGTAFAMANACPEVLAACDYRTFSNDADGVAVVLERLPGLEETGPRRRT
jgi:Cof subfamily protein (haloacid dehalogenase superfamily)